MMPTDYEFRFSSSTPMVSRSNVIRGDDVILIEGAQFEDGKRRIVVGSEVSDETMKALDKALRELDRMAGARRWLEDLLAPARTDGSTNE